MFSLSSLQSCWKENEQQTAWEENARQESSWIWEEPGIYSMGCANYKNKLMGHITIHCSGIYLFLYSGFWHWLQLYYGEKRSERICVDSRLTAWPGEWGKWIFFLVFFMDYCLKGRAHFLSSMGSCWKYFMSDFYLIFLLRRV